MMQNKLRKNLSRAILACMLVVLMAAQSVMTAKAVTLFESDGIYHEEGFIFIGESHSGVASHAVGIKADETGNVLHLGENLDVYYEFQWDSSHGVTNTGLPNTFTMKGNLFFIFEGINPGVDDKLQTSQQYIYSDGNGKMGRGVEKIHEIIAANPNIEHWNIISIHGAVSAAKGSREVADYYVDSYRNWIEYEFPEADCYFLSVATMTKYYKGTSDKKVFNNTLKDAFPDRFWDYTDFYSERYAQGRMVDTLHWDDDTYMDLVADVVLKAAQKRQEALGLQETGKQQSVVYTVTQVQAVFYTNENTVVYEQPSPDSTVILAGCEAGLPVSVTGITDKGYFQIDLGGMNYYVHGIGLDDPSGRIGE